MLHTTEADLVMLLSVQGVPQSAWLSSLTECGSKFAVCKILITNCLLAQIIALIDVLHRVHENFIWRLHLAHVTIWRVQGSFLSFEFFFVLHQVWLQIQTRHFLLA